MIVYHATPRRNLPSIITDGLLRRYHTGRRPVLYLVRPPDGGLAIAHVATRHLCGGGGVVLLRAHIPDSWAVHHAGAVWWTDHDIAPERIWYPGPERWVPLITAAALGLISGRTEG